MYVVGKPLWWALEQLGIVGEDDWSTSATGATAWSEEYVVLTLVEKAADAILLKQRNNLRGPGDALYSMEGFRKEFAQVLGEEKELSAQDLRVLLTFLERDRKALVVDANVGAP